MAASLSSRNFTVRNNFITLHCTDADPSIRPDAETHRVVRSDGTVDFMQLCTGEDPTLVSWKTKIGTFLAEVVLGLPEVKGRRKYMLSALPQHYALFVHKKGDKYNPRHDAYLWGSKRGMVFRSPAEFFLHARWLLLGCPKPSATPTLDEELFGETPPDELVDRCGCKYCAKTDQRYISEKYSNYHAHKSREKGERARTSFTARYEGVM